MFKIKKNHVLMGLAGIACFVAGCVVTKEFIYNTQDVLSKETMNKLINNVGRLNCEATVTSLMNTLNKEGLYTDKINEAFKMTQIVIPKFIYNTDTGKVVIADNTKFTCNCVLVNK